VPDWLLKAVRNVEIPTLVIWGVKDSALLPLQLDGLDNLVDELTMLHIPDAGHFAPWEAPDQVAGKLEPFLAADAEASAAAK
jgi:pimeloyl-ACP methyl ester carboxylesterase